MVTKTILVVDDEADIRTFLKTILEDEGYSVSTAESGKDALAKLKKDVFDLVLLDFFMPEMSGRELAETIRADPKLKGTRLAFLTVAEFGAKGRDELKKLGSLDYIRKPIKIADFKKRMKKIV